MRRIAPAFVILGLVAVPVAAQGFMDPEINRLLDTYPELRTAVAVARLLAKPLLFLTVFLFISLVLGRPLCRVIAPGAQLDQSGHQHDEATSRRLAIARLITVALALVAAFEATGVHWFGAVLRPFLDVAGMVALALGIAVGAAAVAVAWGERGRDIALSLLGWHYLRAHPDRPAPERQFDLGDGRRGTIARVDALHTTFVLEDGARLILPNAWVMKTHFGWGPTHTASAAPPPASPPTEGPAGEQHGGAVA